MKTLMKLARTPQGRKFTRQAMTYAQSPQGRKQLAQVQRQLKKRR